MSNINSTQRASQSWSETVKDTQALKNKGQVIRTRLSELAQKQQFTSYPSGANQSPESKWAETVKITQALKDDAQEIRRLQSEYKQEQRALQYKYYGN